MSTATRRPVNLTLSADTLAEARSYGLNLSRICDDALKLRVQEERATRWKTEHAEFVRAYNTTIETEGLPLDEHRGF